MNEIKFKLIKLVLFFCLLQRTYCQTLSCGFGPIFTQSLQKVKIVNGINDFENTGFSLRFDYMHQLNKSKIEIGARLNLFQAETWMSIRKDRAKYEYGNGFRGLKITRIDLGIAYDLIKLKHFYIKNGIGLGLQIAKRNGYDPFDSIYEIYGPDYAMIEPFYFKYNFFQIVPFLSVKAGFVFWNRLDLHLDIQGVYGFKSYQTMYLNYSYKGIRQNTAVVEARGTGLFPSIGIGYRFKKYDAK